MAQPRGMPATALPLPPERPPSLGSETLDAGAPWRDLARREGVSPGMLIDDELARLGHVLASLRAAGSQGEPTAPPRASLAAWERILRQLDAYLDRPPRDTPPVQLVRAQVTIETELELDGQAWRLPGHLTSRVQSRLAYIEQRIESSRSEFAPIPEGGERPLVYWPVEPVVVTSDFGWRRDPFHGRRRFHYGVDLQARPGQLVSAAGEATVEWADWNGGHGKHIELRHPGGWRTRYSHLAKILVRAGDEVRAGDPIGLAGDTGRATGPHLHFEVWRYGDVRNPMKVLDEPPVHIAEF